MTEPIASNPFFVPAPCPFMPPFDKIKESDHRPAIEEGMKRHGQSKIANNKAAPTFNNICGMENLEQCSLA